MNTNNIAAPSERKMHVKSTREDAMVFNPKAVFISILDRWGKPIWQKKREESLDPISWNGIDCFGDKVTAGSYLCKIVYPDQEVIYLPFVFIQK